MRSCSMALQLLSTAVGSYLGGALVAAVAAISKSMGDPWLPRDLNHGHMDYFLMLMGVLMTLNTIVFVWVAMRYEYKVGGRVGSGCVGDFKSEDHGKKLTENMVWPHTRQLGQND